MSERNTLVPHGLVSNLIARGLHISSLLCSQLKRFARRQPMEVRVCARGGGDAGCRVVATYLSQT